MPPARPQEVVSWQALLSDYLRHLQQSRLPATAAAYRHWIQLFVSFCQGRCALRPAALTLEHIEEFHKQLLWEPNSTGGLNKPHTVYMGMRVARDFVRWCVSQGALAYDPTAELILPAPSRVSREPLGQAEFAALLAVPDRTQPAGLRDLFLLVLLASTDLGLAACSRLDVDSPLSLDLHLDKHRLAYLRQGRPQLTAAPTPALFLGQRGRRLGAARLQQILRDLGRQAGHPRRLGLRLLRQSYRAQLQGLASRHPFSL